MRGAGRAYNVVPCCRWHEGNRFPMSGLIDAGRTATIILAGIAAARVAGEVPGQACLPSAD